MSHYQRMHTERERAESFGTVAEAYDRYRPPYPAALLDDLAALGATDVLDVGCGTGRAGRALADRGMTVHGVEIDPAMAQIARRHGLSVDVSPFERWDPRGRTFDLVVSGQAWHWLDPRRAVAKAASVLRPGGTLAVFWNVGALDEPVRSQLDAVYRRRAPELLPAHDNAEPPYAHDFDTSGFFEPASVREYEWQDSCATQRWVGMVQTHSDHVTLDPAVRAAVLADVAAVVDAAGGQVLIRYRTYTVYARTRR
jgi:SAM-dependent methyltransferase